MTNREVLAKFLKQTFDFEIKDNFDIGCRNVYCSSFTDCTECPGKEDFWDKEFNAEKNYSAFADFIYNL